MEAEPLTAACELAFAVAREGEKAVPPIEPPASMRNYLYVASLPRRAMSVAQRAIDEDPQFRARVAAQASEQSVGETAYLWLTRPTGWDLHTEEASEGVTQAPLAANPAEGMASSGQPDTQPVAMTPAQAAPIQDTPVAPVVSGNAAADGASIQDELASLRGLVQQLSTERESLAAESVAEQTAASAPSGGIKTVPGVPEAGSKPAQAAGAVPPPRPPRPTTAATPPPPPRPSRPAVTTPAEGLASQVQAPAVSGVKPTTAPQSNTGAQAIAAVAKAPATDAVLSAAKARITQLEGDLAASTSQLAQARSDAEASKSEAAGTVTALEASKTDLAQVLGSAQAAKTAAAAQHEADLLEISAQRDAAAAELSDLKHEHSLAVGAVVERDHLSESLLSMTAERDELTGRVKVAEQARLDLETELSDVSRRWQDLQVELEGARASLRGTRGAFESSVQSIGQGFDETERILSRPTSPGASESQSGQPDAADPAGSADVVVEPTEESVADVAQQATEATTGAEATLNEGPVALGDVLVDGESSDPFSPVTPELSVDLGEWMGEDTNQTESDALDVPMPVVETPQAPIADLVPESGDLTTMLDSLGLGATTEGPFAEASAADLISDTTPLAVPDFSLPQSNQFDDGQAANPASETLAGAAETESSSDRTTRVQIDIPADVASDPLAMIRHVVSTEDVVVLVDGDAVAEMGWPETPVSARREALVKYLSDLAADTGAAQDTVFSGALTTGDDLPVSRAVRVRITAPGVAPAEALAELVDSYPQEWPVAVVSDDAELAVYASAHGATVVENGQLLDLLFDRWEQSQGE